MEPNQVNLEDIQKLIEIADRYALVELTVAEKDLSVTIRGTAPGAPAVADPAGSVAARRAPARATPDPPSSRIPLVSPMTGVFYRAPSPDAPNFVEVGDIVEAGQTIGLIEAMKV
ncbi:MAG: hypothetical protein GX616_26145, partial [Planctomycetes bacterium]|nr:hypothetical protein [Planctomycetota bacterium]